MFVDELSAGGLSQARPNSSLGLGSSGGGVKGWGEFCFLGSPSAEVMNKPYSSLPALLALWVVSHTSSYTRQPTPCLRPLPEYLLGTLSPWKTKQDLIIKDFISFLLQISMANGTEACMIYDIRRRTVNQS